jgi:hypothetical protein
MAGIGKREEVQDGLFIPFFQDGIKYKKPVHLPAPQYISLLMDWVETQINDEQVEIMLCNKSLSRFCFNFSCSQ